MVPGGMLGAVLAVSGMASRMRIRRGGRAMERVEGDIILVISTVHIEQAHDS